MIKTFTENDLVRFIYKETSGEESRLIENAIVCDSHVQEQYSVLQETILSLDNVMRIPGQKVVERIMNYSKNFNDLSVSE